MTVSCSQFRRPDCQGKGRGVAGQEGALSWGREPGSQWSSYCRVAGVTVLNAPFFGTGIRSVRRGQCREGARWRNLRNGTLTAGCYLFRTAAGEQFVRTRSSEIRWIELFGRAFRERCIVGRLPFFLIWDEVENV